MFKTILYPFSWLRIEHTSSHDWLALRILQVIEHQGMSRPSVRLAIQEVQGDFRYVLPDQIDQDYEWSVNRDPQKSQGHLAFVGDREYFQMGDWVRAADVMIPIAKVQVRREGAKVCMIGDWPRVYREIVGYREARERESPRVLIPVRGRMRSDLEYNSESADNS